MGSREKRRGHGGFASEVTDVTATLGKVTDEAKRRVPPAPYSDPTAPWAPGAATAVDVEVGSEAPGTTAVGSLSMVTGTR